MSNKTKRFILPEDEIPRYWYNIQADMVNKPMPPLNPATKQPLKAEDLYPIFAQELCRQELNQTDAWIEIPEQVREMYTSSLNEISNNKYRLFILHIGNFVNKKRLRIALFRHFSLFLVLEL